MRRTLLAGVALLLVVAAGVALWAFEPWRLWTSSTVDEPLPGGDQAFASVPATPSTTPVEPGTSVEPVEPAEPVEPVALAESRFEDAEHDTSGTALVLELADGRRYVRLEQLDSSDGPDLHLWLTDQPSGGPGAPTTMAASCDSGSSRPRTATRTT